MKGTVKFFNEMKGFGFIQGDDGKEYFVHMTGLNEGVKLNENDPVSFDPEEGDRGPKAVNVSKAGESTEAAPEEAAEEAGTEEDSEEPEDEEKAA